MQRVIAFDVSTGKSYMVIYNAARSINKYIGISYFIFRRNPFFKPLYIINIP